MNYKIADREAMLIRVRAFCLEHADRLPPAAAELVPQIAEAVGEIGRLRHSQVEAGEVWRSGAIARRENARLLRTKLVDLAQTGRILARKQRSGLADQLKLARKMSYSALEATGAAFVEVLTPLKATFIARGFPATFLEEVSELIAALRTANETKLGGLNERVESTSGLEAAAAAGVELVRDLDAMLSRQLRETAPELHAAWKRIIRIRRESAREPDASPGLLGAGEGRDQPEDGRIVAGGASDDREVPEQMMIAKTPGDVEEESARVSDPAGQQEEHPGLEHVCPERFRGEH